MTGREHETTSLRGARRVAIAGIAFVGHAPALRIAGYRLRRAVISVNLVAVAVTLIAMAVAGIAAGGFGVLLAWLVGHVLWGALLAGWIVRDPASALSRASR